MGDSNEIRLAQASVPGNLRLENQISTSPLNLNNHMIISTTNTEILNICIGRLIGMLCRC